MRFLLVAFALLVAVALPVPASAADIVINNGLAPPNPANVVDDATYSGDDVYVRNVGCPPAAGDPWDPCPSPGAATEVQVVVGGVVADLSALDSSTVTLSGGTVASLSASGSSTVTVSGGTVTFSVAGSGNSSVMLSGGAVSDKLLALESASVTLSGGTVSNELLAYQSSTITIVGRDFEVDGSPQPYGDLSAQSGTLTGTLASGDPVDNAFQQGGGIYTGTITLVAGPLPVPSLSSRGVLTLAVAFFAIGLMGIAVRRRHRVR